MNEFFTYFNNYIKAKTFFLSLLLISNYTFAQTWQQTNGPYGGAINCIAISGMNLFAGTNSNGVFISTNNGTSWNSVNNGFTDIEVFSLEVSGTNLYAGTYGNVFLSTNNGTSWTSVNNGLTNGIVSSLLVSGTNLYAGTGGGVFLSTNNGTSWTSVNKGLTDSTVGSLAVSGTNLYAGTYGGGVFLSTNSGTSWTSVNNGLTDSIVYSLSVIGTNLYAGTFGGLYLLMNANATQPVVSTLSATSVTTNSSTLNGSVNANGFSTAVQFDYGTTSSYGSSITATPSNVNGNFISNLSALISGLNSNTMYHYRIEATNILGTTYGSDISFQTFSTTTSITYSYTFGGDITNTNNYEIIGIPGNSSLMLSSVLSGTESQDWVAYYDNGAVNNYLVEFDNSSLFEFSPGNGFWVLSKNPISLSQTVPNVSLDSKGNYSIPLHAGWNIISNPFSVACLWDSVISLNGLSSNAVIYNWNNGNWLTASVFTPYFGYYFYNSSNLSSLTIPYNATGKLSKISVTNTNEQNHTTNATGEQVIKISLISNGIKTSSAYAEINPKSIEGYDQYDLLSPPSDFKEESLTLINDSLALSYKNLIIDSRPAIGDGMAFNIAVTNKQEGQLSLNFSGLSSFNNYECYLMDNNSKEFFDLNNKSNISIRSSKASGYELFIGNKDYIEKQMEANAPSSYYLYQNYPNPFNPSTVIRYALSFNSNIKIELYNILGERVKELINGEKEAGFHELNFNATGLASGVYFYTIEARSIDGKKEFRDTKKMVLLK